MGAVNGQFRIRKQGGVSLTGVIVLLAVLGSLMVLGLRLTPAIVEYQSIKNAITQAKNGGGSVIEMRQAFDKNASVNDITAINGKDLEIVRNGEQTEISFAYEKRIPLVANATLLLEFAGSTEPKGRALSKTAQADK